MHADEHCAGGSPQAKAQWRRFLHACSSLFLCCFLVACGRDAGEIEFWAMGREGEVVRQMVPEFERLHPGHRVRVQQIPWSAAHEKLLTAYVGDSTPCAVQLGNTWIPELVALDALEPLDGYLATSRAVQVADYFPGIVEPNVVGRHHYGVPWYVDTRLLFYRADIAARAGFAAPPATWDDWRGAMEAIKRQVGPDRFAILLPLSEWQTPVILALQLGAGLLRDGGRYGDFQSQPFRRAFAFYLDLFAGGLAPRQGDAEVGNLYQDFAAGFFSFFVTGPWNLGELAQRLPPQIEWATAPMPAPSGQPPGVSVAGGASLAIFRSCGDKPTAWKWIEFLSATEQQVAFYRASGDLPPRRSAWRQAELVRDARALAFWTQLEHLRSTPKVPEWERIADKISQYAEAAIRGDLTPDAALAALDADVDRILAKRRWMLARD